jgi:class 3 adenylate cyclase
MSEPNATSNDLSFTPEDAELVEAFRRRTDTSVLTIMFTDIEGFTAMTEVKGDRAANALRWKHDELVVAAVEEGGAGKVVKHIGDAVLAVFSEPSAAVERALAIQARLREFNRSGEGAEELRVRIGLHMGQVTTENTVDLDVFGRHVNRASRMETLAGGGQVLLTYPVIDSARGWLAGTGEAAAAWTLHGEYYVKGLAEPIAVYEVYNPAEVQPSPPQGARRKRPRAALLAAALGLVLAAAAVWLAVLLYPGSGGPGTLTLVGMPRAPVIMDHKARLILDGVPGQHARTARTKIPPRRAPAALDVRSRRAVLRAHHRGQRRQHTAAALRLPPHAGPEPARAVPGRRAPPPEACRHGQVRHVRCRQHAARAPGGP